MTTQLIDIKLIKPNPYQSRSSMDPAKLQELAESITANGLLQPPQARAVNGHYQLVFGHRRFAAYQIAKPKDKFPLEVVEATDREMFDKAIAENDEREPLNPVERARALQAYIETFKVTQAEAGKVFHLSTQGAVSNVLRLLKLSEPVQAYVVSEKLPERLARQLIAIDSVFPQEAAKIAKSVAEADPDEKQDKLDSQIDKLLRDRGRRMFDAKFKANWIPLELPKHKSLSSVPACNGCEFMINKGQAYCARPECFDLKSKAHARTYAAGRAKQLGIAPLADEQVTIIDEQNYANEELIAAALKAKHPSLRLVANPKAGWDHKYRREKFFGNNGGEMFQLGSTDISTLKKDVLKADTKKPGKKKSLGALAVDRQQSWAAREKEHKARRKEIEAINAQAVKVFLPAVKSVPEPVIDILMSDRHYGKKPIKIDAKRSWLISELIDNYAFNASNSDGSKDLDSDHPDGRRVLLFHLAKLFKVKPLADWQPKLPDQEVKAKKAKKSRATRRREEMTTLTQLNLFNPQPEPAEEIPLPTGSTCSGCGKPILWRRTHNGKPIPLNPGIKYVCPNGRGSRLLLINEEGHAVQGFECKPKEQGAQAGRESHFATCPKAEEFRK